RAQASTRHEEIGLVFDPTARPYSDGNLYCDKSSADDPHHRWVDGTEGRPAQVTAGANLLLSGRDAEFALAGEVEFITLFTFTLVGWTSTEVFALTRKVKFVVRGAIATRRGWAVLRFYQDGIVVRFGGRCVY